MNPFAKFGSLFDRFRKNRIAASDSMPIAVPNPIVAESPLPIGTGTPFLVRQTSLTHLAATQTTENTLMEMVLRDAAIYACAQDEVGRDEDRLSGKAIVRFL